MQDVIDFFGSKARMAYAMGVTRAAVSQWTSQGAFPPLRAVQIERLTGGKFRAVDLVEGENDEQ